MYDVKDASKDNSEKKITFKQTDLDIKDWTTSEKYSDIESWDYYWHKFLNESEEYILTDLYIRFVSKSLKV